MTDYHPYDQFEADGEDMVRKKLSRRMYVGAEYRHAEMWLQAIADKKQATIQARLDEELNLLRRNATASEAAAEAARNSATEASMANKLASAANEIAEAARLDAREARSDARFANRMAAIAAIIAMTSIITTIVQWYLTK